MTTLPFEYATRNLGRSVPRLVLSVLGAALVVLLTMAGAGFAAGMDGALRATGHERNVILLGAGSEESMERSEIKPAVAGIVAASVRGIAGLGGQALVSPEISVPLPVQPLRPGEPAPDPERTAAESRGIGLVRGVTAEAFLVHPQVRLVAGRAPESGADEVILGASAAKRAGFDPRALATALRPDGGGGPAVTIDARTLRVVGLFEAPGTVMDGEVWMPLTDVLVLTQRDTISAVVVALGPDAEPADLDVFAQRRLDLELSAIHEPSYYAAQSAFYRPVRIMVLASAVLVAAGALLGGINTMYAAFASRVRELGTLQVLGFTRTAIAISLLQESLLASMTGALLAVGAALWLIDGIDIQFSMGTFGIAIDQRVVALGLAAGLVVGAGGCIVPAIRCLRMPLPAALKSD